MDNRHHGSLDNPEHMTTADIGRILEVAYEGYPSPTAEYWSYVYDQRLERERRNKRGTR